MTWEKLQCSILTFYLHGDKDGPLKGWKKILHFGAGIFSFIVSVSWYIGLHIRVAVRRVFGFMIGQ